MKTIKTVILVLFLSIGTAVFSQELNCKVTINASKIQGSNQSAIKTLEKSLNDLMNNRHWTNMKVEPSERIEANINIILKSVEGDTYTAEMMVQSRRPVYGASYTTTLLNRKDNDLVFRYTEYDPIEFVENGNNSNIAAVMAYYAFLMIGYDLDSFEKLGGNEVFKAAEKIVNEAQTSEWTGWKAFENDKNRYAIINNLMDEAFKKFRTYQYEYHRLGLDEMSTNPINGRDKIAQGLSIVREAYRARPSGTIVNMFLDAKNDELVNIFSKADTQEKEDAYEILTDLNPAKTDFYEKIRSKK